jgi:hypothetical protein
LKNWVKRALRTFAQAALGYVFVAVPTIDFTDVSTIKAAVVGVGVSGIAAGIAAVMNYIDDNKDEERGG